MQVRADHQAQLRRIALMAGRDHRFAGYADVGEYGDRGGGAVPGYEGV